MNLVCSKFQQQNRSLPTSWCSSVQRSVSFQGSRTTVKETRQHTVCICKSWHLVCICTACVITLQELSRRSSFDSGLGHAEREGLLFFFFFLFVALWIFTRKFLRLETSPFHPSPGYPCMLDDGAFTIVQAVKNTCVIPTFNCP